MKHKIKTFFILSSLVALTMFVINRIIFFLSTSKKLLGSYDSLFYNWRFGKVRYIKRGSGNPILLIHDLTAGSSLYEYHQLINNLAEKNEVYAIDLLGYGLSDKTNMTYTNFLYVQLITDFIKNIIGKKTNIIATGDSAPIAVMVSHNDSEAVYKIILINPQNICLLNQIPSKRTKLLKWIIGIPILGTFIYNLFTTREKFKKTFYQEYFQNPTLVRREYINTYREAAHIPDLNAKYTFSSYVGKYTNANILHALKKIDHSILILAGREKDNIEDTVENYTYYNIAIESAYIEDTKHLPHMEKPEEVLSQISIFLN